MKKKKPRAKKKEFFIKVYNDDECRVYDNKEEMISELEQELSESDGDGSDFQLFKATKLEFESETHHVEPDVTVTLK